MTSSQTPPVRTVSARISSERFNWRYVAAALVFLCGALAVMAQTVSPPATPPAQAAPTPASLTRAELEDLLAPIALYPDVLLAQILTAATFPMDIVKAARWLKTNPDKANLMDQQWDPSVMSLCNYPDIINKMNDDLDWTSALGAAFLDQGKDVMDVVQELRRRAEASGALRTTPQQSVVQEEDTIRIVPAQEQVVYVPQYDPQVVYVDDDDYGGAYYGAGYGAAASAISFGAGVALGSWLDLDCDWHGHGIVACRPGYWGGWGYRGAVHWGDDWATRVGRRRGFIAGEDGGVAWGPRGGAVWGDNGHGAAWRRPVGASPRPYYGGRYRGYASRSTVAGNRGYIDRSRNVNVNRTNVNVGNRTNIGDRTRVNTGDIGRRTDIRGGDRSQFVSRTDNRAGSGGADRYRQNTFNNRTRPTDARNFSNRGMSSRQSTFNRPSATPRPQYRAPQQRPSYNRPVSRPQSSFASHRSGAQMKSFSHRGGASRMGHGGGRMGGRGGGGRRGR